MRSGNLECTEKFIAYRARPVGMWFNNAHAHSVADTQKPSFVDRLANRWVHEDYSICRALHLSACLPGTRER